MAQAVTMSNSSDDSPAAPPPPSLRRRAIAGTLWWSGVYPILKAIQIASSVILAGLLSPAAFGLVAIATVVVRAVSMLSEFGVEYALIQSRRDDEAFVNTAWTLQLCRGAVVCLACAVLAGPVASLYGHPEAAGIVRVIGVGALVGGLQSTNYVTLNRTLNERPRALLSVAEAILTRGVMIGIAVLWPTAWSLVLGVLTGIAFVAATSHMLPGRRNRLMWDREAARALMKFGSWVVVGAVIAYLGGQADTLLLGKIVSGEHGGLALVGVYTIAQRVANLPLEAGSIFAEKIGFPLLADVARREPTRFRERLLQIRAALLPLGISLCLGVLVVAPWFFRTLYDDRYAAARWMAPLMTISVWAGFLNGLVNRALLALGLTRATAITGGVRVVASVGCGLVGFQLGDVPGFIVGLACGELIRHMAELHVLTRSGVSVHQQDVRYTVLLLASGIPCALVPIRAFGSDDMLVKWGAGVVVPMSIFLAVTAWAGRGAWRLLRSM